ncbi:MAG: hypothetical protein IKN53_06375 [Oscillibacter sp.]|nr:hypothetical protein [Oscillibacter sp.]
MKRFHRSLKSAAALLLALALCGGMFSALAEGGSGTSGDFGGEWDDPAACEHVWGDWVVDADATCTTAGVKHHTCSNCQETERESIPALGHKLVHHDAQAASCEEVGWAAYDTCSRDGCGYTTKVEIPALGHTWGEWIVDVQPTTESAGHKYRECSTCHQQEEENIAPLGSPAFNSAVLDGTQLTVKVDNPAAATLLVAFYQNDQMIALESQTVTDSETDYTVTAAAQWAKCKFFLLDSATNAPIAKSKTCSFENAVPVQGGGIEFPYDEFPSGGKTGGEISLEPLPIPKG